MKQPEHTALAWPAKKGRASKRIIHPVYRLLKSVSQPDHWWPSSLKVACCLDWAMDGSWLAGCTVTFVGGYLLRSSYPEPPKDCPACSCVCNWTPSITPEVNTGNFPYGWCFVCVVLVILLLVSNAALACKITFRDGGAGQDKEIQINVKGKSKGIYSAGRGLAITG